MKLFFLFLAALAHGASATCTFWCNSYTCGMDACGTCSSCQSLSAGDTCMSWCNSWTCSAQHCKGCDVCDSDVCNTAAPQGVYQLHMEETYGLGINAIDIDNRSLTPYLQAIGFHEFTFTITIEGDQMSAVASINADIFGGALGPFTPIVPQKFWYTTNEDGGMLTQNFHVAPDTPLCPNSFETPTGFSQVEKIMVNYKYLADTDRFQYYSDPTWQCEDARPHGPLMLDPFIKSFYMMLGRTYPYVNKVA